MTVANLMDMKLKPATKPDFNGIASKVKAVADRDNIPRTVHPREKSGEGETPPPPATPSQSPQAAAAPVVEVIPPTPLKRVAVFLPEYVVDDIERRALKSTRRFVVLKALKAAGFHVNVADLIEDGRRKK